MTDLDSDLSPFLVGLTNNENYDRLYSLTKSTLGTIIFTVELY